jgi:hypothetical protein
LKSKSFGGGPVTAVVMPCNGTLATVAILTHFSNQHLMTIAELFCANSLRIKEQAWWCITRSELAEDGERLHAYADAFGGQLSLTIWDDGAVVFNMMKGYRDGQWDWELRFHGNASQLAPKSVLDLFTNSITSERADLLPLWESVQPHVEYGRQRTA